jgi:hypothetical protein
MPEWKRSKGRVRMFEDVQAAVREGPEQAERGEGISLEEFDQQMRRKYRMPP